MGNCAGQKKPSQHYDQAEKEMFASFLISKEQEKEAKKQIEKLKISIGNEKDPAKRLEKYKLLQQIQTKLRQEIDEKKLFQKNYQQFIMRQRQWEKQQERMDIQTLRQKFKEQKNEFRLTNVTESSILSKRKYNGQSNNNISNSNYPQHTSSNTQNHENLNVSLSLNQQNNNNNNLSYIQEDKFERDTKTQSQKI